MGKYWSTSGVPRSDGEPQGPGSGLADTSTWEDVVRSLNLPNYLLCWEQGAPPGACPTASLLLQRPQALAAVVVQGETQWWPMCPRCHQAGTMPPLPSVCLNFGCTQGGHPVQAAPTATRSP